MLILLGLLLSNNSIRRCISVHMSNPFELTNIILVDAESCTVMMFPNRRFSFPSSIDLILHWIVDFCA